MKTVTNYPNASLVDQWIKVGAATAHQATDDDGNISDYILATGFTGGKVTEVTFPPIPTELDRLKRVRIIIYALTVTYDNEPGVQIEYYIGATRLGRYRRNLSSPTFQWFVFDFPNLNYNRTDIVGLTRKVRITPIDGGYYLDATPNIE